MTLELSILALIVALLIAVPAGIMSAIRKGSVLDRVVTSGGFIGLSIPSFMLAIIFVYIFALNLQWLPATGFIRFTEDPLGNLQTMILPALTLGIVLSTQFMRYLTGRRPGRDARGLRDDGPGQGRQRTHGGVAAHRAKCPLPFVTVLGLQFGYLLSGAVIIEEVFALPGMGRLALSSLASPRLPGGDRGRLRHGDHLRPDQPGRRRPVLRP